MRSDSAGVVTVTFVPSPWWRAAPAATVARRRLADQVLRCFPDLLLARAEAK